VRVSSRPTAPTQITAGCSAGAPHSGLPVPTTGSVGSSSAVVEGKPLPAAATSTTPRDHA
jgi:hypothetical protein